MKRKIRVFFTTVDIELDIPDNLDEREIEEEINKYVYDKKIDEITNETMIDYFEDVQI